MFGGRAAEVVDAFRFHHSAWAPAAATVRAAAAAVTETQSHECLVGSEVLNPEFVRDAAACMALAEPRLVALEPVGPLVPRAVPAGRSHQSRAPPLA